MRREAHDCPERPCPWCDHAAEARLDARAGEVERPDVFGRDADWNWPRGFGGGTW